MKIDPRPELLAARSHSHFVEWFVGTGTTTVFRLSKTPQNASQLLVFVDGLLKRPSLNGTTYDYALSGSTVTLTTAPASGKHVACVEVAA